MADLAASYDGARWYDAVGADEFRHTDEWSAVEEWLDMLDGPLTAQVLRSMVITVWAYSPQVWSPASRAACAADLADRYGDEIWPESVEGQAVTLAEVLTDWLADDPIGYHEDGRSIVAPSDAVAAMAAALVAVEAGAAPVVAIAAELARLSLDVWICERVGFRVLSGADLLEMVWREAPEWLSLDSMEVSDE